MIERHTAGWSGLLTGPASCAWLFFRLVRESREAKQRGQEALLPPVAGGQTDAAFRGISGLSCSFENSNARASNHTGAERRRRYAQ